MPAEMDQTRVLVAEDERDVADLYEMWLADEYDVQATHSGEAALDAVAERGANVVLLDRQMPGLSGDEVAYRLGENGWDGQVVMVTADSPSPEIAALPVDDYLMKPVRREQVRSTVETAALVETYDDRITELLALTARRQVLEAEVPADELETSEEFARLTTRIAELQDSADETVERLRGQLDASVFARIEDGLTGYRIENDGQNTIS